jgi:hypothetical protein
MSNSIIKSRIKTSCENLLDVDLINRRQYRICENIGKERDWDINYEEELQKFTSSKSEKNKAYFENKIKFLNKTIKILIDQWYYNKLLYLQNKDNTQYEADFKYVDKKIKLLISFINKEIVKVTGNLSKENKEQYLDVVSMYKIIEDNKHDIDNINIKKESSNKILKNSIDKKNYLIYIRKKKMIILLILFFLFMFFLYH